MRINLNVPFDEKDIAKRRGALWDNNNKTWYIVNQPELDIFKKWIPEQLLRPTQSQSIKHEPFKVTQPRTPRKINKKIKKSYRA